MPEVLKSPEAIEPERDIQEKYGRNVEIRAIFARHGEKTPEGTLAPEGFKQAREKGEALEVKKSGIKGYTSAVERAVDTCNTIIEAARTEEKFKTRKKLELTMPAFQKEILQKYKEIVKEKGENEALQWLIDNPANTEMQEWTANLAKRLDLYIRMADRLKSGSEVDLVNASHASGLENLFRKIAIHEENGEKITGFEDIKEFGGGFEPAESFEVNIKTNKLGEKSVTMNLRGQEYGVDLERLRELVKQAKEEK